VTPTWKLPPVAPFAGALLVIIGAFGPWIPHKTAALTVTGIELVELAKFFPQIKTGAVPVVRAFFTLPLLTGAIALALLIQRAVQRIGWRILLTGLTLVVMLPAAPPYPYLKAPEYRLQLILVLAGILIALLTPLSPILPDRARGAIIALLALAGLVPPIWNYVLLHPLVAALYGAPVGVGWGFVTFCVGSLLLFVSGLLGTGRRPRKLRFQSG